MWDLIVSVPDHCLSFYFEHIFLSSLMAHFDRFNVLCDNQRGFSRKRSCETQLIVTTHVIAKHLSSGSQVDAILLDFEKELDKVPNARLLQQFDIYGMGNLKTWIGSFLSGRKRVVLDYCKSTEAEVLSGVPQGTVLGPLLFLAFINDLPDWTKHSDTRLFVDDYLLFRQIKGQKYTDLLQHDITALEEYMANGFPSVKVHCHQYSSSTQEAASAFRKLPSIYVFSYFPFGFEGRIWDLIVSVPDHCLSFYFSDQPPAAWPNPPDSGFKQIPGSHHLG